MDSEKNRISLSDSSRTKNYCRLQFQKPAGAPRQLCKEQKIAEKVVYYYSTSECVDGPEEAQNELQQGTVIDQTQRYGKVQVAV